MKKLVALFLLCFMHLHGEAQSNKWPVRSANGDIKILNFTTPVPTVGTCIPGYATGGEKDVNIITDESGKILFVTAVDGNDMIEVRDQNLNLMPNGSGLRGNRLSYKSAISKMTCHKDRYFFFHHTQPDSLFYSVIDMDQNGGLGNIPQKNVYMGNSFSDGMTISHQMRNGCRWLMVPGVLNNSIIIYSILVSDLGVANPFALDTIEMQGPVNSIREIEFSPDNRMLCLSINSSNPNDSDLMVYDFILEAGTLMNRRRIECSNQNVLGIEFSPDNSKIYFQTNAAAATTTLGRVNLTTGFVEIIDSLCQTSLSDLETAGNGKIYSCSNGTSTYLSEIADPNNPVPANVLYTKNKILIDSTGSKIALPNVIDGEPIGTSNDPTGVDFYIFNSANCQQYQFVEKTCLGTWWEWDFGDGTMSYSQSPIHHYDALGDYDITLKVAVCADTLVNKATAFIQLPGIPISVSPDVQTCNGQPTVLTASGADDYYWMPSNGLNTTTGPTVIANPVVTTTYTVTGSDASGCLGMAKVVVTPLHIVPSITASASLNFCIGNSITLTANGGLQYTWNDGTTNQSKTVNEPGTYSVIVCDHGCQSIDSISVSSVNTILAWINVSPNSAVCKGGNVQLAVTGNGIVSQQWFQNNVAIPGMTSSNISANASGTYSVAVADANGCVDTVQANISFLPSPKSDFQFTTENCSSTVIFANTSTGATSSEWRFPDGKTSSKTSLKHEFPGSGDYNVTLITTNNICVDSITKNVKINPPPTANFSSDTLCNLEKQFKNLSKNGTKYFWSFEDGSQSSSSEPVHTFPTTGKFNVKLIAVDERGCKDNIEKEVIVARFIPSDFSYDHDTCTGNVTFHPNSPTGDLYTWNFGDDSISLSLEPLHFYYREGIYRVRMITNAGYECADQSINEVNINEVPNTHLYVPNTFTPNGDGINENFKIFGFGKCGATEIRIYSRWGELVYTTNDLSEFWDGKHNGEIVAAGVYSYTIVANGVYRQGMIQVMY